MVDYKELLHACLFFHYQLRK